MWVLLSKLLFWQEHDSSPLNYGFVQELESSPLNSGFEQELESSPFNSGFEQELESSPFNCGFEQEHEPSQLNCGLERESVSKLNYSYESSQLNPAAAVCNLRMSPIVPAVYKSMSPLSSTMAESTVIL